MLRPDRIDVQRRLRELQHRVVPHEEEEGDEVAGYAVYSVAAGAAAGCGR